MLADADSVIEALRVSKETQEKMAQLTQRAEDAATGAEEDAQTASQAKEDAVAAKNTAVQTVTGFNDTVNSATEAAVKTLQDEGAAQIEGIQNAGAGMEEYAAGVVDAAKQEINGAKNAAVLAIQMLALSDDTLSEKLLAAKQDMIDGVKAKNEKLQAAVAEL